ncbi:hypothetical protein [Chloroflexus aggregans]|uniref:Uncharacterized protein n=1 Tax=Chloroflexus aggregans (strain MD-66 / DSM 9485) TaxID=326427 RepID=B8GBU3_CHLAD|nr:hypothetical protein [Chloroflexus aggregans]ACL24910.1 conserved hypothetical protein [Chloroflexus aggregans DSM 9485]
MRGRAIRPVDRAGGGEEAVRLTRCAGTWLADPPDAAEQARIAAAVRAVSEQRTLALELHRDQAALDAYCIELFRDPIFDPLHIGPAVIRRIIDKLGEPPVDDEANTTAFSEYLQRAVLLFALPNPRRLLAAQLRRYLPRFTEVGDWKAAVAIDYSAFRTSLGNEVTPFLAQMTLAGLADYYDELPEA